MPWKSIVGHDAVVERFRLALRQQRLAHAYLFAGPEGVGKKLFAITLAQVLLCERGEPKALDSCQQCHGCRQVAAGTHPDFFLVEKPEERHEMPVELFIGAAERRGREGLCYDLSRKPARGKHKVAVVNDVDFLNDESANCLLKTLEEPPPGSVLILIGTNPDLQLPTIRSRCVIVRFAPLSAEQVRALLLAKGVAADVTQAELLAAMSEGSMSRACELADEELWDFRRRLLERLAGVDFVAPSLSSEVVDFVEAAGSDSARQRARARVLVGFCAGLYRHALRELCGGSVERRESGKVESRELRVERQSEAGGELSAGSGVLCAAPTAVDEHQQRAVAALCGRLTRFRGGQQESEAAPFEADAIARVVSLLERCLEADSHIQRRVQLPLAIEAFFDDLGGK
ncbi:MAG: DNA polymerase III subunit delta' [Planctomycetes bacterium]|nr:DNA polymerase III subunit delta' [Planctomycetota bacterium]